MEQWKKFVPFNNKEIRIVYNTTKNLNGNLCNQIKLTLKKQKKTMLLTRSLSTSRAKQYKRNTRNIGKHLAIEEEINLKQKKHEGPHLYHTLGR